MIPITPLAGRTVLLNLRVIERIEETPETVIVLAGGRRMVVVDIAPELVARIHRAHAKVMTAAARGAAPGLRRKPTKPSAIAPSQSAEPDTRRTTAAATAAAPEPATDHPLGTPVSNVNNLHTGQIAFDRTLASISRYRWAMSQQSADTQTAQQELARAHATIRDLPGMIDLEHSSDIAKSLADTINFCATQLAGLAPRHGEEKAPRETEATLRFVETTLTGLRKIWARIAADASPTKQGIDDPATACRLIDRAKTAH
ncbi:MAG: flagellar FlbD family protein [Actinomycetota bacterium]|nr:flagellar FlbD family protein [Actinomycetota bacterium]